MDFAMVLADPNKATINIPDQFLIAIGKVCIAWGHLEDVIDLCIPKLAGMDIYDSRSRIMINHATWPQRIDILGALINALVIDYPRLKGWDSVSPLLKKAQEGRNRIIHGHFAYENDKLIMARSTSRGKLKVSLDEVTITEINEIISDIQIAAAEVLNLVILNA